MRQRTNMKKADKQDDSKSMLCTLTPINLQNIWQNEHFLNFYLIHTLGRVREKIYPFFSVAGLRFQRRIRHGRRFQRALPIAERRADGKEEGNSVPRGSLTNVKTCTRKEEEGRGMNNIRSDIFGFLWPTCPFACSNRSQSRIRETLKLDLDGYERMEPVRCFPSLFLH